MLSITGHALFRRIPRLHRRAFCVGCGDLHQDMLYLYDRMCFIYMTGYALFVLQDMLYYMTGHAFLRRAPRLHRGALCVGGGDLHQDGQHGALQTLRRAGIRRGGFRGALH